MFAAAAAFFDSGRHGAGSLIRAPHQRREAIKRLNAEKETLGEIARSYNVSR
jgi:hypothetical protein